mmetsp:Transcript_7157/g.15628  ORF Transcript_7157/g.15628 Transcript_7157/m.15628 type:complete len:235 (-) Transcript_7157:70-774(-)
MSTWAADNFTLADVTFTSSCSTCRSVSLTDFSSSSHTADACAPLRRSSASLGTNTLLLSWTSARAQVSNSATWVLTSSGGPRLIPHPFVELVLASASASTSAASSGPFSPPPLTLLRLRFRVSFSVSSATRSFSRRCSFSVRRCSYSLRLTFETPRFASARRSSASSARMQASLSTWLLLRASSCPVSSPVTSRYASIAAFRARLSRSSVLGSSKPVMGDLLEFSNQLSIASLS